MSFSVSFRIHFCIPLTFRGELLVAFMYRSYSSQILLDVQDMGVTVLSKELRSSRSDGLSERSGTDFRNRRVSARIITGTAA